ncbi:uncharacterized protein LOC144175272 [Haemaphysalis longicornis]
MLGDLHRNESEFAVGPFVITAMTSATFPPGYIYHYDPFQFLAGIEQPFATEIFTKVSTFDIQMWLLMFVYLVLLTSISLRLLSVGSVRPQKLGCLEKLNRWNDMFFLYFSGLIQRASSHRTHANNVAFRVLLCMWLVCAFFVMNFFTANMSASMMVKTEAPRIRTVADVLRTPNKRILLFADSGFTDLLMYSEVQSYRAVYGQILRTGGEVIPKEVFTERNMHRLLKQDAVILQEGHSLLYQVSQKCRSLAGHGVFYLSEELLASLILSWYTRPDFDPVLRHEIDVRAMWSVEHGLLESYVREVLSGGEDCFLRMSDKSDMEHRTLVFEDLRPMFLLALLLLQLATIVFIAEILIGTLTQMPRRHRRYL